MINTNERFATYKPHQPVSQTLEESGDSIIMESWDGTDCMNEKAGTTMGVILAGTAQLSCETGVFPLREGMYFAIPGPFRIEGDGTGFHVTKSGFEGLFQIGGPIERTGRLRYISGCSDSLLVPPVIAGDPCLNFLHVPPEVDQTAHTHPSVRIGMIIDGRGVCRTNAGDTPLEPGTIFVIPKDVLHSFHTQQHELRIVAWHPDSDTGPTDDNHPMLNRTILEQ